MTETEPDTDQFETVKVAVQYPESLGDEISRQLEAGIASSRSEWFREAAAFHLNVSEFPDLAEIAEETEIKTFLSPNDGEEPRVSAKRTTISIDRGTVEAAGEAVEAGVVDSRNEWFRDAAFTFLTIQQLSLNAGANVLNTPLIGQIQEDGG